MLAAPPYSPYDLRFRLLDVPVRVNAWFWLVMLMISGAEKNLTAALVFVVCAFVSILVHEFGHGLTARAVGREPSEVVLYAMGGLCYYQPGGLTPLARFLVIAAGPGAGFGLLGLVFGFGKLAYGIDPLDAFALLGFGPGDARSAITRLPHTPVAVYAFWFMIYINLMWGILNLLPIWPLDGGQMAEIVLGKANPRHGTRWAHVISLLTAGGVAFYFASREPPEWWPAVWFGFFAFRNYQRLQEIHQSYGQGDSDQWWRGG